MTKFVKPTYKGKKGEKIIIDAACKGEVTAYVKHQPTGALVPVTTEAVVRMKNGETMDVEEAERLYDRFFFKLPSLASRWGMENEDCLGRLMELGVPCFFNPGEVENNGKEAKVGQDDVCVFLEYVVAVEKNKVKKINDIEPRFIKAAF